MFSQLVAARGCETAGSAVRRPLSGAPRWAIVPGSVALVVAVDRDDQLRRRPGGGAAGDDQRHLRTAGRRRRRPDHGAAHSPTRSTCCSAFVGARRLVYLIGVRGHADGARSAVAARAAQRLRPHPDPDRLRLPGRPLLQPLRLPGAGAVHLPALRPARQPAPPTSSAPPAAGSTTGSWARTRSGTCRSGRWSSATSLGLILAHDRAIAYWGDYRDASRSQYWMLAVMVLFTCFGLYLLSSANA